MGLFSWKTCDTEDSIPCEGSVRDTFTVYLLAPNGVQYREDNYQGYGVFGGKDAYQLVAELNRPEKCNGGVDHDRRVGIDISCYDEHNDGLEFPIKIARHPEYYEGEDCGVYETLSSSKSCPDQGFFYGDDEEDTYYIT